jgi:hypothetical protein
VSMLTQSRHAVRKPCPDELNASLSALSHHTSDVRALRCRCVERSAATFTWPRCFMGEGTTSLRLFEATL